MTAMGADGMEEAGGQCMSKALHLRERLSAAGLAPKYDMPVFHEFVTTGPGGCVEALLSALEGRGILGGLPLSDQEILWCATEMNTKEEMDQVAEIVSIALSAEKKEVG